MAWISSRPFGLRLQSLTPILMITASSDTDVKFMALERANDLLTCRWIGPNSGAYAQHVMLRGHQKALSDRASWLAQEVSQGHGRHRGVSVKPC